MKTKLFIFSLVGIMIAACDPLPIKPPKHPYDIIPSLHGMYVLNEGGYNMNNASLDYLDFQTGQYILETFTLANPSLVQGLGDVANDINVYGSKTYIAVNGSGLVEVIDTYNAKHLGQISIPNCRRICAYQGAIYVTSYAGRVEDNQHQLGYVAKIDTSSLTIIDTCEVGYQPEGLCAVGQQLFVVNSGGYVAMNTGEYDNRLSVIDLTTFTRTEQIEIAPNLQDVIADNQNRLWIISSGDYGATPSALYSLSTDNLQAPPTNHNTPITKMVLVDDRIYFYATTYDMNWQTQTSFYSISTLSQNIDPLALDTVVPVPYAIKVNEVNHDIYVADAGDYVNPGSLYCFTESGSFKWKARTGVIPTNMILVK